MDCISNGPTASCMLKAGAMSAAQVGDTRSQRVVGLVGPQKKKVANLGYHFLISGAIPFFFFLLEGFGERSNRFQKFQPPGAAATAGGECHATTAATAATLPNRTGSSDGSDYQ